ncbi:hypothetical protein HDR58_10165 [bacterium]|nr:hypothetical protein [bacterium]
MNDGFITRVFSYSGEMIVKQGGDDIPSNIQSPTCASKLMFSNLYHELNPMDQDITQNCDSIRP